METILGWFRMRPLRLVGGFLVFLSLGLLIYLVLLDLVVGLANPYIGILVYLFLPALLVLGLILVPLDAWFQRRRAAAGLPPYPVIDLADPKQRRIAGFFAVTSVFILITMTVITYKAIEYMDTKTFCGTTCHHLMIPEYTTYLRSAHANVACVECHIGPGATWFVRAKLSGVPQVWHYLRGDYPRPVPTPVKNLRPSRETCEACHWPGRFYGGVLRTTITYGQDRANTPQTTSLLLRVGSGGVYGSGIHSHIVGRVYYLPANEKRSEMAWIRVYRPDGSRQDFVNPTYQGELSRIRSRQETRLMDCIDCHNRAAHEVLPFETNVDNAIVSNVVDRSLPFIKQQAMQAVGSRTKVPTEAEQDRTVDRINDIAAYYQRELPDVYRTRRAAIDRSVAGIQDAYLRSYFPQMRVGPDTYPNWRTHEGCFRCHGVMIAASAGRDKEISADCTFCHSQPTTTTGTIPFGGG